MPFHIINHNITELDVECIVNPSNNSLVGEKGGTDYAVHMAAGPELLEECKTLGGCETGEAKITKGHNLKAKYVIHTVGPIYQDGKQNEPELLKSCYKKSLELANEHGITTIAFPSISTGTFGFPKAEAHQIAMDTILRFLRDVNSDMTVYLVLYSLSDMIADETKKDIYTLLERNNVRERRMHNREYRREARNTPVTSGMPVNCSDFAYVHDDLSVEEAIDRSKKIDSFGMKVFDKLDELGMSEKDLRIASNIDSKLFSKFRKATFNPGYDYHPSKNTAISYCIGLKLSLKETREFLSLAGYSLSNVIEKDVVIAYFIQHKKYNIHDLNICLFDMGYDSL